MNENGEAVSAIKTQISRFQATARPKLLKIDILTNKCYSTFVKYIQKKKKLKIRSFYTFSDYMS